MLDIIGTIFIVASMAVILVAITERGPRSQAGKLAWAAAGGAWIGLAAAAVGAGALTNPLGTLSLFGAPLLSSVALALGSPSIRRIVGAIPLPTLVGLNAARLGGAAFVMLALDGRLGGPFPYSAGIGDFITGALALPVAWLAAGTSRARTPALIAWNAFGMLDLVVAVALGVVSRNGSPLQLIHAGVGTAAMQTLPWAFVVVLVPFYMVNHAVIFARLAGERRGIAQRPSPAAEVRGVHP